MKSWVKIFKLFFEKLENHFKRILDTSSKNHLLLSNPYKILSKIFFLYLNIKNLFDGDFNF